MKNNYIQKIRGLLILGVIFIHCMFQCENNLYNCIIIFIRTFCNLSVPIFIFLSAYFYNIQKYKNNPKSYVYQKIKRLIIPLLIWNLIYFIVNYNKLNFKDFITFDTAPQLYFILVLIQLIIITPLLIKGLKNKNIKILLFSITPICLILYRILSIFFHFTFPFYKLFFTNWLIYYLIGLEINMSKKNNNNYKINTPILLIIGGGVLAYNLVLYYFGLFNYAVSQMNCVNMIFSIAAINYLLLKHQKNEPENFLSKIGNRAIGIFFIHMLIKKIINKLIALFKLNELLTNQLLYILIITFLIYFISYIIIEVFSKITKGKFDTVLGFK